jgi:hypothetical protein
VNWLWFWLTALVTLLVVALVNGAVHEAQAGTVTTTILTRWASFDPQVEHFLKGQLITWHNPSERRHSVTGKDWQFYLSPGESHTRRIWHTQNYVCVLHGAMDGRLVCENC